MTPQEIFDTVVRHLSKQGKPAKNEFGGCYYRSPDGLKCAVGGLIPDDSYRSLMDEMSSGTGIKLIFRHFKSVLPAYFGENLDLLSDLQGAHDDWGFSNAECDLGTRLVRIAKSHNISDSVAREHFPPDYA